MQETHLTDPQQMSIIREFNQQLLFSFSQGTNTSKGVLIAVSKDIVDNCYTAYSDDIGRTVAIKIKTAEQTLGVICSYAPNMSRTRRATEEYMEHLDHVTKAIDACQPCDHLCWCGDFNLIFNPILDAYGGDPQEYKQCIEAIEGILLQHNLIDIFRTKNPTENLSTYRRTGLGRRLDYMMISRQLYNNIKSFNILPYEHSDHDKLVIKISGEDVITKPPKMW